MGKYVDPHKGMNMNKTRFCACGCGERFTVTEDVRQLYIDKRHKNRVTCRRRRAKERSVRHNALMKIKMVKVD